MKHVVIPTDFSVRSLNLVRYALNHFQGEKMRIILLHLMEIPDGISDLLMLPRERKHLQLFTDEYRDEVEQIRTTHRNQVDSIFTDFLYVGSQRVFNDYMKRHQVDAIVYPSEFELRMPAAFSVHPATYIHRCQVPVLSVRVSNPAARTYSEESGALQALAV